MAKKKNLFKMTMLLAGLAVLLLLGLGLGTQAVRASQAPERDLRLAPAQDLNSALQVTATPEPTVSQWNPNCVMCHQSPNLNGVTQDSLQLSLMVDTHELDQSVHGEAGLKCTSCHTLFTNYPHLDKEQVTCAQCHEQNMTIFANLPYENRREMQVQLNQACYNCHSAEYSANSMHTPVDLSGLVKTPLCTDCHGGHNVQHPTEPPARVVYMCSQCHTAVSEDFLAGEHNSADPKTQTCITCHIPHEIPEGQTEPTPAPQPTPVVEAATGSFVNEWSYSCTMCHTYANFTGKAEDESTVSLTVTDQVYSQSVHAQKGLGCAACHETITGYPHQDTAQVTCSDCHSTADNNAEIVASLPHESTRALSIEMNQACRTCHEDEYDASSHGMHSKSLEDGNVNAPLCSDCHGSHDIQPVSDRRAAISQQCASCHGSAYSSYQSSVHGVAVEKDGSPDAATCVDCHGVHDVSGPRDSSFRNESVAVCTKCHTDPEMMAKYGIASDVFNPNVDNFHGQAVSLFDQTNHENTGATVVCYDCHGIHSIRKPTDPASTVNQANLMKTCQQCHPDASSRFAGAGLAHGQATGGTLSVVTWLNRIYAILIFAAFIVMLIYIILDGRRRRTAKRELVQPALIEE